MRGAEPELTVEISEDEARSWRQIATIACPPEAPVTRMHEPHVVETGNGNLVAQIRFHYFHSDGRRDDTLSYLYQSVSRDYGQSWSTAAKTRVLGYPPHLIRLDNGWLLSVYARRFAPFGEYACISTDGGGSWETDREILLSAGLDGDLGYPASTQLADGSIFTVYYQKDGENEKPCLMGTHWRLDA